MGSISVIIVNGTSISSISSASNVISITINATAFLPLSSNYSLSKLVPVTVAGTTWNLTIFQTTQQESFTQNQNSFARYLSSSVTQNIVVTWQNGVTLPPIANQAYCVFGTSSPSPVYASATMVNSTSFSCIVPPSCTSLGILSMILSYNRPSLSNNWSTLSSYAFGSVISLCIKDRAPQVVIAQFQNQANLLQIAFDMEVTAYNTTSLEPMSNIFQPVACSCYFDSSMVGIMWRDGQLQDCSAWFTVGSTMSVAMSPMVYTSNHSLAISSTTKVKLLDAVFYNKTSIFGMATSGAYSLSVPSLGTLLNANIVVPFIWTGCNDLPIDLSQMLNHYGRPIQNVTVTSTQTPSLALSTALNSIMSQIKTGSTLVYFPVSLFIPNTWLNITFGSMSTGFESYQNVTTSTYCPNFKGTYPAPAIISPSVSADVTRSTRLSIVDLGDCPFPNLPLVVNWSYVPSFLDNSFNISTCIGSTSSELTIPANSLLPGLYYTFQVAVSFQGFNARVFQAAFQTKSASIQLFAGGSRSVGYLSTIQMTGIAFWRPSTTVTYIAAEYQWYCQRVDGTPCITSGTIPSGISVDLTRKLDGDLTYMLWLTYNSSTISSLHAASDVGKRYLNYVYPPKPPFITHSLLY